MNSELAISSPGSVILLAFWTVFVAELVGDKSIYNIASLSLRFPWSAVLAGISVAFTAKILAAVCFAQLLAQFHFWTNVWSAGAFFVSALLVWIKEPEQPGGLARSAGWWRGAAVSLGALFLTEWGDPSQLAVAALAVKTHSILTPWLGGTLAMMVKGILAMTLGTKLRELLPAMMLRTVATASLCLLGILALSGLVFP